MILSTLSRRAGFTLLELVLVLSIMGVVSTIGMTGFFRITTYWNDTVADMAFHTAANQVFEAMSEDMASLLSSRVSGTGVRGAKAEVEDDPRHWRISFEDDRLSLPVEIINPISGERERLQATYVIDRAEGRRLLRMTAPLGEQVVAGQTALAEQVCGMRIQFFDGAVWRPQWDAPEPPRMMRVSLLFMDDMHPERQVARVKTFPVMIQ